VDTTVLIGVKIGGRREREREGGEREERRKGGKEGKDVHCHQLSQILLTFLTSPAS
jgi:hypothetical protein